MRRYIDEYFEVPEEQTLKPSPEELKEIVLSKHNEGMKTFEIVRELQETLWLVKPPTTKVAGIQRAEGR